MTKGKALALAVNGVVAGIAGGALYIKGHADGADHGRRKAMVDFCDILGGKWKKLQEEGEGGAVIWLGKVLETIGEVAEVELPEGLTDRGEA